MRLQPATCSAALLCLLSTASSAQNGAYDVRFELVSNNPLTREAFVDIELRANAPSTVFHLGDQNYRFTFNTDVIEPMPSVSPLNPNPMDQSVAIWDPILSGFILEGGVPTFYSDHNLVGTIFDTVSVNLLLEGAQGVPVTDTEWRKISRLRIRTQPTGGVAHLTWLTDADFPPTAVREEVNFAQFDIDGVDFQSLSFDTDVVQGCPDGTISFAGGCAAGHHAFGGPVLSFGGSPTLGGTLVVEGQNFAATGITSLNIGLPMTPVSLSLFGSTVPNALSCVDAILTLPGTPSSTQTLPLPIPANLSLCGAVLDMQWIDYAGTGIDFGTSRSARVILGQ